MYQFRANIMTNFPILETITIILLISFLIYKNHKKDRPLFKMNIYSIIFIVAYLIIVYRYIRTMT